MYGAIIGDLAGSIYEYSQIKKVYPVICKNLIEQNSFISDDTILTIAILDAILQNKDYGETLKEYGKEYETKRPDFSPYFKSAFSPGFIKWIHQDEIGTSIGNGAMMRISPIGYLFDTIEEIETEVTQATIPSHNSKEAIDCAMIIAKIIFYARKGYTKEEIMKTLDLKLQNRSLEKFNMTCSDTIDICLYTVFHANSFEESIRNILLYGGDTDTNACIVGSMAEALYGIDQHLIHEANQHLPEKFQKKLIKAYQQIKK